MPAGADHARAGTKLGLVGQLVKLRPIANRPRRHSLKLDERRLPAAAQDFILPHIGPD